jgi:large subunit ribosomal protein L2
MNIISTLFKSFKAHTPGIRQTRLLNRNILLNKIKPLKFLRFGYRYKKGRNHSGRITVWHRGGGHKRLYRKIDFKRTKSNGIVEGFEYDPNRKSWIIRLFKPDLHLHSYILGVKGLKPGNLVSTKNQSSVKLGDHLKLKDLPSGFVVHNLSSSEKKSGQYLRAAGTYGQLIGKTPDYARIKLRSGEHRLFSLNASASLGPVCNENSKFVKIGKAGRNRWYGIRPCVRGVAINPVDHPHGGGEGKTSGGRPSVTPWGKPTKGQPTQKFFNIYRLKNK